MAPGSHAQVQAPPGSLPTGSPRRSCPALQVKVQIRIAPTTEAADFTTEQLRALAERSGQPLRHAPYGFYAGSFEYQLAVDATPATDDCADARQVRADLALVDRRIEVASDLKSPCLLQDVLSHYRLHAAADERAFREFSVALPARIKAAVTRRVRPNGVTARRDVIAAFRKLIPIMDRMRHDAQASVDSPSEASRLAHPGCST